ncbi:hypothetical protein [Lutispora thermophila]|uniref:Uncharacterized protein n=1 Tax=Lutispora thermophila DSM 19022 TaxID=1122184 RepID=A0A1M6CB95_9FIRM|nr:hypothetical protein [Lutispora thermophila]SHI58300.1 hypothetical protein SAMN02745176_00691 [Lutispora thermophila DSM 19022]
MDGKIACPQCGSNNLIAKFKASYVYSYRIGEHAPEGENKDEFLPFLFDNREKVDSKEYLECENCRATFPCDFNEDTRGVSMTILQKAIRSDHTIDPEFYG